MALAKLNTIDLTMAKKKMMLEEGKTGQQVDTLEVKYRRFLALCLMFPSFSIVPTIEIDDMWHQHILDTQGYDRDTRHVFGYFLHHNPYFGLGDEGSETKQELKSAFDTTGDLYEQFFGEPYLGKAVICGSAQCDDRPQQIASRKCCKGHASPCKPAKSPAKIAASVCVGCCGNN